VSPARQRRVLLRLSTEEHERVKAAAVGSGMTAAGFAAEATLAAAEERRADLGDPRQAALQEALGVLMAARTAVNTAAGTLGDLVVGARDGETPAGLTAALEAYRLAVEHLDAAAAEVRRGLPR
jgi:hypothetical protein